jgi:hypothetical protein
MSEEEILAKLNDIIVRLERIERRQATVREELEKTPAVGSFGTTDTSK